MAAAAILNFKISIFGHVTVFRLKICYSAPNFYKIGRFFTKIWRFNDSKMAAVRHLGFQNLQFLSCGFCRHAVLLPHTKFRWNRTIGRWFMAIKAIFKMAVAAILNFKNFKFLVTRLLSSSIFAVVWQTSSKSDDFSVRYSDLTIFKMAAVRHLGF